jgi:outer membrane protein OmpA-like peptidoglycan-associated protein
VIEDDLGAVARPLDAARREHLDLIAPRRFARAREALRGAREAFDRGGRIETVREGLAAARAALGDCAQLREIGLVELGETLRTRDAAVDADAARHAAEAWEAAEEMARRAGRAVEDGDHRDARRNAERARLLYGEAELEAIRNSILGPAREARRRALERDAAERAPATLAEAESLLAAADGELLEDRYRHEIARRRAEEAAEAFRHAARIAAQARRLDEDRQRGVERLIRTDESRLADIAAALDLPAGAADAAERTARVLAAIADREARRRALEERVATLEAHIAELESRVATLADREALLRDRERRERTLREVRALFTPAEAEVVTGAERLTVRLLGLTFEPGSSALRPEHYALLSKLLEVLRRFDKRPVRIEGHTDAQGDADSNQRLSQERANAVREYVLANSSIAPDWVLATGHGESRPIASNDTAEGRARNRRIDVVIDLMGL